MIASLLHVYFKRYKSAEFICTTAASNDNKVSKAFNSLPVLRSPPALATDGVCLRLEKGNIRGIRERYVVTGTA